MSTRIGFTIGGVTDVTTWLRGGTPAQTIKASSPNRGVGWFESDTTCKGSHPKMGEYEKNDLKNMERLKCLNRGLTAFQCCSS